MSLSNNKDFAIEKIKFHDDKKWKEKVYVFKESFMQCEMTCEKGKFALLHANEEGFNYFIDQLNKLNLHNVTKPQKFIFEQQVDQKRTYHGLAFIDEIEDWELDLQDYVIHPNLNGYAEKTFKAGVQGKVAHAVEIYWYPEEKRIMAASINYETWTLKFHFSPQGLEHFLKIVNMANTLYYDQKIFYPSQKFVEDNGPSIYALTEVPALPINEEHVLFLGFRKEILKEIDFFYASPKVYNPDDSYYNKLVFFGNPYGWLQIEAILMSCIEQFAYRDYMDFHVTDITSKIILKDPNKKRTYVKIRYVFLKNNNEKCQLSFEHDPQEDILYFYVNLKQLLHFLEECQIYLMDESTKTYRCRQGWYVSETYEYNEHGSYQTLDGVKYGPSCFNKFETFHQSKFNSIRFHIYNKDLFQKAVNEEFAPCSWKRTIKNQDHRVLLDSYYPRSYFIY